MKRFLKHLRGRKLNNKGMSLVELICAIGIMSLLGLSVAGVMIVSADTYRNGSNDADLQQEAQLLVNQVTSLVQDAVDVQSTDEASGSVLKVQKDSTTYIISRDDSDNSVNVDDGSVSQPLASNVSMFLVDTSDYNSNGVVKFYVGMLSNSRSYAGNYTVAVRNASPSERALESNIQINCDDYLLLEPNEVIEIPITITGATTVDGIEWELVGNTDSNTVLDSIAIPADDVLYSGVTDLLQLTVGRDENASEMVVLIKSKQKRADMITPSAQKAINVRVRRVNDIILNGTLTHGSDKNNGAVYKLTADVLGNNLGKITSITSDADYSLYTPYLINWNFLYSENGTTIDLVYDSSSHTFENALCKITLYNIDFDTIKAIDNSEIPNGAHVNSIVFDYNKASDATGDPYVELRLKQKMENKRQFLATAICLHPNGRNRSTLSYVDSNIYDEWSLNVVPLINTGASLVRGSDAEQYNFSMLDSLKGTISARTGIADYNYVFVKYWRYRPVYGEGDYGAWTGWMYMKENNWNPPINLRPGGGLCLRPDTTYQVELTWKILNKVNGSELWPALFPETPKSSYLIDDAVMNPVTLYYSFNQYDNANVAVGGSDIPVTAGDKFTLYCPNHPTKGNQAYFTGIDRNFFTGSNVEYILQRKVGDEWINAYEGDAKVWKSQSDRFDMNVEIYHKGTYRVLVQGRHIATYTYDWNRHNYTSPTSDFSADSMYVKTGDFDYALYDEETGRGIFSFVTNTNTDNWNNQFIEINGNTYKYTFVNTTGNNGAKAVYKGTIVGYYDYSTGNDYNAQLFSKNYKVSDFGNDANKAKEKFLSDVVAEFSNK